MFIQLLRRPKYCGRTVVDRSSGYTYFPIDEDYGKLTFAGIGGMDTKIRAREICRLRHNFPTKMTLNLKMAELSRPLEDSGADLMDAFADPFGPDLNLQSKSTLPNASMFKLVRYIPGTLVLTNP